jgi:site-specific recombinase XerD
MKSLLISVPKLDAHIKDFINTYLGEKSDETRGTYERALREFQKYFLRAQDWFQFRQSDVEEYKKYLMDERNLSQVSVSTYLTALRRLLDYFVSENLLDENPAKKVKGNKRPVNHNAGVLSQADVKKLLAVIPREKLKDHRDYLIIRLMLDAAASEHELVKADIEDLKKYSTHYVLFVQAKGQKKKEDAMEIPLELGEDIEDYLEKRIEKRKNTSPLSPLLVSHGGRATDERLTPRALHYRIMHWLREAGVARDNIKPHSLRHTAAKLWLERDKLPIEEVRRKMRHGMIATTKIYDAKG